DDEVVRLGPGLAVPVHDAAVVARRPDVVGAGAAERVEEPVRLSSRRRGSPAVGRAVRDEAAVVLLADQPDVVAAAPHRLEPDQRVAAPAALGVPAGAVPPHDGAVLADREHAIL